VLWFRLADRFGDNGLISVVILKQAGDALEIDTWVMSCRVLGRTMEEFIANEIQAAAQARGCTRIIGRYRPSAKNGLVAGLYARLGFEALADDGAVTRWQACVDAQTPLLRTFVERVLSA
jgi:FkbH-like protein